MVSEEERRFCHTGQDSSSTEFGEDVEEEKVEWLAASTWEVGERKSRTL